MPSHPAPAPGPRARGTLFIVATPIGNLDDISVRALRVLREVAVIAAEDTRHTARLLNHYDVQTPMLSLHEHNERERIDRILARLAAGESVALVSDAGTPLVSDPGAELVAAIRAAGMPVVAIPGASAVLTALVASGVAANQFTFFGFPPRKQSERQTWLRQAAAESRTLVIYEAPHRIHDTLTDMIEAFGARKVVLCRELTKIHEEFLTGTAESLLVSVEQPKGEYVIVVAPEAEPAAASAQADPEPATMFSEFCRLTDFEGLTRRDAVSALARRFAMPSRAVYALIEEAKRVVE
jgi:16S rRNA (cytidine1402-2'-O)-methyltransferase